ncbi:MAG: dipeptide epimerase [Bacteroidia bacterium]|jgi:L-alanine-DL-glutamate epimerase-like enolase superfamily enzyme|nr:dipeptide epimerase [Bacteroidia bacterium]MCC6768417.1 dipeptide epimerase [Bacteroidia bacterium]
MCNTKLRSRKLSLPFKHPFTISGGRTKTHQPLFQLALSVGGLTGYGEAPEISYYGISVEQMEADLQKYLPEIENHHFSHPEKFEKLIQTCFPENSFLRCALDMAAWDLYGKMQQKPVHSFWDIDYSSILLTDFTIGIASLPEMLARINENPWPVYKIKLGFENDVQLLSQLREKTNVPFRLDVNGGWTFAEAREKLQMLGGRGIEMVEQALPKTAFTEAKALMAYTQIPLFADESCVSEQDVLRCSGHFHGINIKLTKCGGITPALRMIKQARKLGMQVMMGSMNESSIGSAAIAQFLPQLDFVDMDGPLLLASDTAKGLIYDKGRVILSGMPGLGVELFEPF